LATTTRGIDVSGLRSAGRRRRQSEKIKIRLIQKNKISLVVWVGGELKKPI
jgi:hypothetical protein